MQLRRLLPYSIPLWITIIFILTASSNFIWIGISIVYIISFLRKYAGKFEGSEIQDEYLFFHYSTSGAALKSISGLFFLFFNCWIIYFLTYTSLNNWQLILFIYSCIIFNSNFAVSLAHDLMHSERRTDRFIATIILLQNGFFYLESDHLFTHHRYVGTYKDPATARKGENLYKYLFRSISQRIPITFLPGSYFPLKEMKKIIIHNYLKLTACILYLLYTYSLSISAFTFLLINYIAVTLIYECITYIQHYGLARQSINKFKFESIQLNHSWNCFYKTSAYMHYMMPVHSMHHMLNDRDWRDDQFYGKEMPKPFATMMLTAWIPSLWFKMMENKLN